MRIRSNFTASRQIAMRLACISRFARPLASFDLSCNQDAFQPLRKVTGSETIAQAALPFDRSEFRSQPNIDSIGK